MASHRKLSHPLSVLLSCFIVFAYLGSLVSADCYWPDGSNAYDMHECYGTAGADGLCCAQGDLCLLNHLCQENGTTDSLYRGACNVQDWTQATTCPEFCAEPDTGSDLAAAQPVGQCWGLADRYFCDTGNYFHSICPLLSNSSDIFTLTGCTQGYNTAGSAMVLTAIPSCTSSEDVPGVSPSGSAPISFDLGPDPTLIRSSLGFSVSTVPTGAPGSTPSTEATASSSPSNLKYTDSAARDSVGGSAAVDSILSARKRREGRAERELVCSWPPEKDPTDPTS
ncbi:hypothetical protein VMCG_10657 [Cytospora schulzeri]|uniref:Uncharacterized protein n=1 Tax=Cytospora schulzeri TaxID=448051 RepID=A0A423V8M9_9PEZI|nr:hypothetical protein VMCG_10657 [Valsa malicola]